MALRIGDHDFGLVNLRRSWAQLRPADTRSPGQARMTTRAVSHQRSGGLADTESELKRRDAARAKLRYDTEEGTGALYANSTGIKVLTLGVCLAVNVCVCFN